MTNKCSRDEALGLSGHIRTNEIVLWCPGCNLLYITDKIDTDYPEAAVLEMRCPECVGGDFDLSTYYDSKGNEVLYDPADIPKHRKALEDEHGGIRSLVA